MIVSIQNLEDVKSFFHHLLFKERLNFHPDEDFQNYIDQETMQPTYTAQEALLRNKLMEQAFQVCEAHQVDIYQLGSDYLFKYLNIKTPKP